MTDQNIPDVVGDSLRTMLRKNLIKHLCGQQITCMRSGEILDYRTCVVLLDSDGDPRAVLSQSGYASLVAINPDTIAERLSSAGLTVDESTVKA